MFKTATGKVIHAEWVGAAVGQPGYMGHWSINRDHLTAVAEAIALRDGRVVVEMHYSELEKCDGRCQNAQGDECTCSCEGAHHGAGNHAAWRAVGDTTLVRGSGQKIVTRELTRDEVLRNGG